LQVIEKILIRINLFILGLAIMLCYITASPLKAPVNYRSKYYPPNYYSSLSEHQWRLLKADSVLKTLSLEEKVGQIFMVSAYSNRDEKYYSKLEQQISKYHLGGIIFFQGYPNHQARLTNRFQSISKLPLLIGMDAEWGLGMRLENAFSFPKALTMGATNDPKLVEECAAEMARHCKALGVHINFAPDADVNTNPENPVINYRSFGSSSKKVSSFARAIVKGFKKEKILSSAKHFPGHGNTFTDSHHALPKIEESLSHLLLNDLLPFKDLIKDSVSSIMIGHLQVNSLDNTPNTPASISRKIIKDYLKGELLYSGLVISDALNMRGLIRNYPTGLAEIKAFKAGNDILLQTADIEIAYPAVLEKFVQKEIPLKDLDYSVTKILIAKDWAGILDSTTSINLDKISSSLITPKAEFLKEKIFEKAVTIVKNDQNLLPLSPSDSVATLAISAKVGNNFQKNLALYGETDNYVIPVKPSGVYDYQEILKKLEPYKKVIVSIHQTHNSDARDFGIGPETIEIVNKISQKSKVILCVFGNPYSLRLFKNQSTLICGYEDDLHAYKAVSKVIYSINKPNGTLPVSVKNNLFSIETGLFYKETNTLGLVNPLDVGLDPVKLKNVENIVKESIRSGEFPGAQILIAKNGKVAYFENYGNHTYQNTKSVEWQSIYDLASLTKVAATLQAVMLLHDQGKLDLDKTLSYYIPEIKNSDKANLSIRELLLHEAGLKSFIPYWRNTLGTNGGLNPEWYKKTPEPGLLQVSQDLYIKPQIKDSVFKWIINSPLNETKRHVYSDLGMILIQHIIERISQKPLHDFCEQNLFRPLGLTNTGYNLFNRKTLVNFVPTEYDKQFRGSQLQGTVHDPNAALLGGVAGHAGLFSNAWDLCKILQMNLNGGTYAGKRYFSEQTLKLFTNHTSSTSHRGLGWNKPLPDDQSVSEYAPTESYGHTGYTGTAVWVDPKNQLIFIMLANRVYPQVNNRMIKNKTRKRIHDAIYQSFVVEQ
jgi:beta-N-acetylhexosaminidase